MVNEDNGYLQGSFHCLTFASVGAGLIDIQWSLSNQNCFFPDFKTWTTTDATQNLWHQTD